MHLYAKRQPKHSFCRETFRLATLSIGIACTSTPAFSATQSPAAGEFIVRTPIAKKPWAQGPQAPSGAPNVVVILTDDVGFGAASTFGGPLPTPTLQALADRGLKYNRFHVTAICSATRAALLTGRNHHAVGMGSVADIPSSLDGYNSIIPKSAGTVAAVLQSNGYSTALIGKSHLTPPWETGPSGPFDRWPTGLGFDYFYGFVGARTDQWSPNLHEGTTSVRIAKAEDYILDKDLADRAIQWIHTQRATAPDRPFFLYYAPGATHSPLHAPAEWIAKFKGQFDAGWDRMREETLRRQIKLGVVPPNTKLAERPLGIPSWNKVPAEQRRLFARQMEVYAAMLAYTDHQIGRVLAAIRTEGEEDNTIVIFIEGDNGASGEGGLTGILNESNAYNGFQEDTAEAIRRIDDLGGPKVNSNYSAGWAFALNTPFPWMKQFASHLGGTRNGLVISWPKKIKDFGGIRQQYHHVTDIFPTILSSAKIEAPDVLNGTRQMPVQGIDMSYSFLAKDAPSQRTRQYYNMLDNAAIYENGWLASTKPSTAPWLSFAAKSQNDLNQRQWELYNLDSDFSQSNDLAKKHPAKLEQLKSIYFDEARLNNAVPGYRGVGFFDWSEDHSQGKSFVYRQKISGIPMPVAPDILNRSFRIEADIELNSENPDGAIVTQGGRFGGYCLCVINGKPIFIYNSSAGGMYAVKSDTVLPRGPHKLEAVFDYEGGGRGKGGTLTLLVDGNAVGSGRIDRTLSVEISIDETFDVGSDTGTPVSDDYALPFDFAGEIRLVRVETH